MTSEIKALTDAQVTEFVNKGTINILGHDLGPTDLRVMYNFGEKGTSSKFEAHSDNDVLVLLDCTPDQSMLDEGTAREVVNRIQKLRKKAGLKPQDEVTLYCSVSPAKNDLLRVITEYVQYIETSTKNPVVTDTPPSNQNQKIIEEKYVLKGMLWLQNTILLMSSLYQYKPLNTTYSTIFYFYRSKPYAVIVQRVSQSWISKLK